MLCPYWSVLTCRSCRGRSSSRCCSSPAGCREGGRMSDRAPEGHTFTYLTLCFGALFSSDTGHTYTGWMRVKCVFLTSRSDAVSLVWYSQRPAYRGLRSCSTINDTSAHGGDKDGPEKTLLPNGRPGDVIKVALVFSDWQRQSLSMLFHRDLKVPPKPRICQRRVTRGVTENSPDADQI